jgi:aryl-alcohol dehydrogenase-like predicted oxidoreductase
MEQLPQRPLGASGLQVSQMSLGSWRTYEHIPREQGVEVMQAAQAAGINFLDDARYDDETGDAPIPTGYSEVVFGELFRAAQWQRDRVVVANKLWWEHWPQQDASAELDGSLERMGFAHVDLIYAMPPPEGMAMETLVEQAAGLIESGRARAWGTGMWTAAHHHEALDICERLGLPGPAAAQMSASLLDSAGPDDPEMQRAFERGPIGLVGAYALAGGTLTGKYRGDSSVTRGRAEADGWEISEAGKALAHDVVALADEWGVAPGHVAFAHALSLPHLASVVFGARTAEQLRQNAAAAATYTALDDDQRAQLAELAAQARGRFGQAGGLQEG